LSGHVQLAGDSAIEFTSGQITSLAAHAQLRLNGNDAFIEGSKAPGSNSALTGLGSIGKGAVLDLENDVTVSTIGSLVNNGAIYLDVNRADGGSSLNIGGALTNSGHRLFIGNTIALSASDKVTAASLDNTHGGRISLGGTGDNQALLDVTSTAGFGTAGTLTGFVALNFNSAIEFATGQITSIANGAGLSLDGTDAFIEDSTALGANSAFTELTAIAGSLFLEFGASLSTTKSVTNSGTIRLDGFSNIGGSSLNIGGALTNTGILHMGSPFLPKSDSVAANSFVNRGSVDLTGGGPGIAALNVSGATTNNGSISITDDTEELAGAVGGTGSFSLSFAHLQFDSSVSTGQTINEGNGDALILGEAQSFAATISGFGIGDAIDATNFRAPPATTFNFVENTVGTGGTLTLTDKSLSLTASIQMTGHYSNSDFTLAPDSGTGTLVKFV
jgi:hypothetical protein